MKSDLGALALAAIVSLACPACRQPGIAPPTGGPLDDRSVSEKTGLTLAQLDSLHRKRSLTNEEIVQMPKERIERALWRADHPMPDSPGEAMAFRLLQQQDENGEIPPNALMNAVRQRNEMLAAQGSSGPGGRPPPPDAGIASGNWSWLGPGNIGGRVRSIVIHPTSTNTMWIGSVAGGVWKSTNGGTTWTALDDFMANLAVATLAMDPADPDVIYAGTGEGFYNSDGIRGAGIFKTTDGGTTWTQLSSTTSSSWTYVNRIAIDPSNSLVLLAATNSGLYRSDDGGGSWSLRKSGQMLDVNFSPTVATNAIASTWWGDAYYSIDNGVTWNAATGLPAGADRIEVAYAPSDPSIVYASVDENSGEVWKSVNGGQTYALASTGYAYLGTQGWYDNIVWVDPTNANTLVVGGIDLWRSTNGGSSFTKISAWQLSPLSAHADNHFMIAHPSFDGSSNKTVFFGNDGGIYKASNVYTVSFLSGWQELNNNLGITQFYGAAGNPTSGKIVGGTQDNGSLTYNGATETWSANFGGDGGYAAADPTDPNYFYGEYVDLQIHRSSNGGVTSFYIFGGIADAGTDANFIAPFILDPNNPNTMLAGGASLWRSTNVKNSVPSWSAIKSSTGSHVSAIAVAKGNSDIVWVGHNGGSVYKTTNGTAASPTWTQMDLGTPNLPNRYCQRITIDPTDSQRVFVAFGGYSDANLWMTVDGGTNWTDVSGSGTTGLPFAPVRSLVVHPSNASWLYAATEVGIFASGDRGANWSTTNDGPTNCSVDEVFWLDSNTLVAATHGRGLWSVDLFTAGAVDLNADKWDEIGVFRNGMWFATDSPSYSTLDLANAFGSPTPGMDSPELGEFGCSATGTRRPDGRVDLAILRKPFSTWQATLSPTWDSTPEVNVTFGTTSHKRLPTRYLDTNGDGCSDFGVFRNGCFDILESPSYASIAQHVCFGLGTDEPLAADLNGDSLSDLLLWRAASSHYTYRLSPGYASDLGADLGAGDVPLVADMNGDQMADLGSYKPLYSTFRFVYSPDFAGVDLTKTHGMNGDIPILADVNGDKAPDIGIFRNAWARWWFQCSPGWSATCVSLTFGVPGDIPIYGKPPGMP